MMAGLPKLFSVLIGSIGIIVALAVACAAQEIQTDSVVLPPAGDIQTDSFILQPVLDLIDSNISADPADVKALQEAFEAAVDLGILTPEQALAMLDLVQWDALDSADALANAAAAILTVLADITSDPLSGDDPLAALTQLLNALATPTGTLTAIAKAGASDEILDQVTSLVASGVPPGILVRITKQGLRDGLSMEEITAQLDALAAAMAEDTESWGNLANEVTDKGENKYQDEEKNTNIQGNEEPEQEANDHGNSTNAGAKEESQGKKDDNPGKGQDKDKDKDKDK
ncbi:hypothetical protein KKG90_03420 [Candidatus Bipolaricaulota bacterium]|nr:hypothetical protein [Candidatus Bipolaricaulota bacterium]